jgi:hypothetical protein
MCICMQYLLSIYTYTIYACIYIYNIQNTIHADDANEEMDDPTEEEKMNQSELIKSIVEAFREVKEKSARRGIKLSIKDIRKVLEKTIDVRPKMPKPGAHMQISTNTKVIEEMMKHKHQQSVRSDHATGIHEEQKAEVIVKKDPSKVERMDNNTAKKDKKELENNKMETQEDATNQSYNEEFEIQQDSVGGTGQGDSGVRFSIQKTMEIEENYEENYGEINYDENFFKENFYANDNFTSSEIPEGVECEEEAVNKDAKKIQDNSKLRGSPVGFHNFFLSVLEMGDFDVYDNKSIVQSNNKGRNSSIDLIKRRKSKYYTNVRNEDVGNTNISKMMKTTAITKEGKEISVYIDTIHGGYVAKYYDEDLIEFDEVSIFSCYFYCLCKQ